MSKKPVGRPKKLEQDKRITLTVSVKKKYKKEAQTKIDNIAKEYQ
jgi:hypothetical protein